MSASWRDVSKRQWVKYMELRQKEGSEKIMPTPARSCSPSFLSPSHAYTQAAAATAEFKLKEQAEKMIDNEVKLLMAKVATYEDGGMKVSESERNNWAAIDENLNKRKSRKNKGGRGARGTASAAPRPPPILLSLPLTLAFSTVSFGRCDTMIRQLWHLGLS